MNTTKKCSEYGLEKDLSEFNLHGMSLDGHTKVCKTCKPTIDKRPKRKLSVSAVNPLFHGITSRELLIELKARGYKWDKMVIEQSVDYDKL